MKTLKRLYYRLYRHFNDHMPCRQEVVEALKYRHTANIDIALNYYSSGYTLEEIARALGVTRERVRQLILKGCRKPKEIL